MPALKYAKRIRELRKKLWPDVDFTKELWHRKRNDGFTTIPRTLPLIISIIDDLTKGGPAGMTYLELWCRGYDEMYVSLSKPREMAFCSGFVGQRAERTWTEKIRKLADLGFIKVQSGQSGPLSHALIMNPYLVIKRMHETKHPGLSHEKYRGLQDRAHEIAATDLDDDYLTDEEEEAEVAAAVPVKKPIPKKPVPKKALTRPIKPLKKVVD
jgi:hypothetical protein